MQKSILIEKQQALQAEFSEHAGWWLPRYYSNAIAEYQAARTRTALMDRSYLSHLHVSGADHLDLLHSLTTNELRELKPGEGQINVFANEKGRIIARATLRKSEDSISLSIHSTEAERLAAWIDKYTFIEDVKVHDLSTEVGTLSLFGPQSPELLASLFDADFKNLAGCHFRELSWREQTLTISRTDELGVVGFDLVIAKELVLELWDLLLASGSKWDLAPLGEDAYDILRIEAGWPLAGRDYDEGLNPHEALMQRFINYDKGCYIGQEVIARLDTYEKVQKRLVGVIIEGDPATATPSKIAVGGNEIGHLTSVTHSPGLNSAIALGYIRSKFLESAENVIIVNDSQRLSGRVVKLPFEIPK